MREDKSDSHGDMVGESRETSRPFEEVVDFALISAVPLVPPGRWPTVEGFPQDTHPRRIQPTPSIGQQTAGVKDTTVEATKPQSFRQDRVMAGTEVLTIWRKDRVRLTSCK